MAGVTHHVGGYGFLPVLALALGIIYALCRERMHTEAGVGREKAKLKKFPRIFWDFCGKRRH